METKFELPPATKALVLLVYRTPTYTRGQVLVDRAHLPQVIRRLTEQGYTSFQAL